MQTDVIRLYFIYLYCSLIDLKIMNHSLKSKISRLYFFVLPIILAYITSLMNRKMIEFAYTVPLLFIWISICFLTSKPQQAFVSTMISFGISHGLHSVSSILAVIITYPIYPNLEAFPYYILAILTAIFHTVLTIGFLHIKRFRNGMPFLFSTHTLNAATVICILFIGFLAYIPSSQPNYFLKLITILIFITPLAFLIFWWQAQLTKSYKHSLELRELESLRSELEEKDKKLAELSTKNEQLGRLIHKDNKLIPALENAVCEYLVTDFENNEEALAKGNSLLLEIREFSNSRANVITEISANKCTSYSTGITSLDTLLNYMAKRAQQDNIQFSVHFGTELEQHIPQALSVDDLVHLLSDLLENALIATTGSANPVVQLQFYQFKKHLVLEVSDNGIPFETASIVNLGLEQLTTHADAGGSGIGLMDIWNIKEKYRASLHIDEYETSSPYAKKISLTFNKKNHYSVRTWRKGEIDQASRRIDLQTFDYKK